MLEKLALDCEGAVSRAFRDINLGGCPHEILANVLCTMEWCEGQGASVILCDQECAKVKQNLQSCVDRHVQSYLGRLVQVDGTRKS